MRDHAAEEVGGVGSEPLLPVCSVDYITTGPGTNGAPRGCGAPLVGLFAAFWGQQKP